MKNASSEPNGEKPALHRELGRRTIQGRWECEMTAVAILGAGLVVLAPASLGGVYKMPEPPKPHAPRPPATPVNPQR